MEHIETIEISDDDDLVVLPSIGVSQPALSPSPVLPVDSPNELSPFSSKEGVSKDSTRKALIKVFKRVKVEKDLSGLSADKQKIYLELTGKKKKVEEVYVEPTAPNLATSKRSEFRSERPVPTEEREIQKASQKKIEVKQQLKQNSIYYKKALDGKMMEIKSNKPPTTHEEIMLRTAERKRIYEAYMQEKELRMKEAEELKRRKMETEKREKNEKFKTPKSKTKLTKPEPFDFASEKRIRKTEEVGEDFVSLQERIQAFYSRRPSSAPSSATKSVFDKGPTVPKAPDFALNRRLGLSACKQNNIKTTEEMQLEEIEKHPKFRARPVNEKVLYGKEPLGVPMVEPKPATTFEEFTLHTKLRGNNSSRKEESGPQETSCKIVSARLNPEILAGPDFVPVKTEKPPTAPEPFNFSTEKRAGSRKKWSSVDTVLGEFRALPMPSYPSKPFAELPKHKPTEAIGFNLHTEARLSGTKRLTPENSCELSQKTFKARPMPHFDPPGKVKLESKVTQPVGFNFATEHRARLATSSSVTLTDTFKARSVPDYSSRKLEIKKSDKPLTKPETVSLCSEKRAQMRAAFDKEQEMIAEATMKEKLMKEKEEEENQKAEVKELRKLMVFKAGKIMKGKPVEIRPSKTPLTIPQGPSLNTEKRAIKTKEPKPMEDVKEQNQNNKENVANIQIHRHTFLIISTLNNAFIHQVQKDNKNNVKRRCILSRLLCHPFPFSCVFCYLRVQYCLQNILQAFVFSDPSLLFAFSFFQYQCQKLYIDTFFLEHVHECAFRLFLNFLFYYFFLLFL
eukprot:TRINITY_DN135068_c0_g1_i1.p1 TRINITY_DN135068_c0_g1~~TRINITY_DN135068_c0_g1_i1.p1  ORF type:complete len:819 (-),score=88.11 TRINITY_DN135068_c0_g1_i1:1369-3747(-)